MGYSYGSIFDLIYNNLNQKQYEHYLISADGGMGKSYEMKKAVVDIYNESRKENQDTSYLVKSYFYDLTDFHYSDNAPWKKVCPKNISEPFYVFLDGLDELSEDNRDTLKKMINEERQNRENTYFVISYRTASFNARVIENIFSYNKVNCHLTIPINYTDEKSKLLMIPFFRRIIDTLKDKSISIKDDISLLELMGEFYKTEFQSLLDDDNDDEIYMKLLMILGDFAHNHFINESDALKHNTIYKFMKGIDEDKSFKDKLEIVIKKGHGIYYNPSKKKYSFSHRIYQEYLIAFKFFQSVLDEPEIPEEFLAGEKNEIIKKTYSNIFALWLQLLDSKPNITSTIKNNAIKLLKTKENIQILFLYDNRNLDETTKYSIFEYITKNLDELPFLGYYIKEITNLVKLSSKEDKLKLCELLLEKMITKIATGTNDYVYLYIQILANITSKDNSIIVSSIVPKTKELIKLILDTIEKSSNKKEQYCKFQANLCNLNDIVKTYEPQFSIYRKLANCIDESYKRYFEVCQISHDFSVAYFSDEDKNIDVIKEYHKALLSIIIDVTTKFCTACMTFPTDEDTEPEIILSDFPAVCFENFLDSFREQDIVFYYNKVHPTEIPDSLRLLILGAIKLLIDEPWIENSTIFQKMMSILIRISYTLTSTENKILQEIYFSKRQNASDFGIVNNICTILKNMPNEYRRDWFDKFISSLKNNTGMTNTSFWVRLVLLSIIPHNQGTDDDLIYYLREIKDKYNSNKEHFKYIYSVILETLLGKDKNSDLFKKYGDDYNYFFGDIDELEKLEEARKTLLGRLKETEEKNIPREIESLFDKDIFKRDGLKIFDIVESIENSDKKNIGLCKYTNIEHYIKNNLKNTTSSKKFGFIDEYPNQIIANCLNSGASKDSFEKWVDTSWNYERFAIMQNYISRWLIHAQEELGIINDRISYINFDNKKIYLLYEDELTNRIEQIKEEFLENSKNISFEIKLCFFTWFKAKDQFDIQLSEDVINDIDDIIKLKNTKSNLNTSKENPFYNLEYLLNYDKRIIRDACIRYIDYVEKNKVEIITDTNGDSTLTNVDLPLSNVLKYLKLNYELIHDKENLNSKIIEIFCYALEKNRTDLCQKCLSYFEGRHINEKKVFAKEIDTLMTKDFIDLLDEDVHDYFYNRLLLGKLSENPKTSFPKTCKILEEKFNGLDDKDYLKYIIALLILDKNTKVLFWLVDYYVEQNGGSIEYFDDKMPAFNIISKYSFCDDDIKKILNLLDYAYTQPFLSSRRETLSRITLSWLYNSANKENFDEIKDTVEKLMVKNNDLKYYINYNKWLTTLKEKVFSNKERAETDNTKP